MTCQWAADDRPGRAAGVPAHGPESLRGETPGRAGPATPGDATVLLVEDDAAVRRVVSRVLRRAGFVVLEAVDGVDALERWREHGGPVALLLTDVVMPRLAGPELVRQLRQERPDLRVLYVSGCTNGAALHEATEFMPKPLHPGELVDRIKELVGLS